MTVRPLTALLFALPLLAGLTGCDQVQHRLGLEDPSAKEARDDAEGKAVGSACRQSGRAIEDCYAIYHWLPKASIFAGWREMNDYMLENKLEEVRPVLPPPQPPGNGRKKARGPATASGETPAAPPGAEATAGAAPAPGTPSPAPAATAAQPPAAR